MLPPLSPFLESLDRVLRERNRRDTHSVARTDHIPACSDCRVTVSEGAKYAPTAQRVYCDPCWRWRQAHGCEFDARTKPQIEAAARKGAA